MSTTTLPAPAAPPAVSFHHGHDLPPLDPAKVPALIDRMKAILGPDAVLTQRADLAVYECDGFTIEKNKPDVVVFPTSTEQVAAVVQACNELGVPFLGRGAGTGLAGGCVPVGGGVMIALSRMKRILEVNARDRYAVVEAGVVNVWLTTHLKPIGYHYAPDPSSQGACTIGGNVATNSGGPHTLKYGVTVNHVIGVEMVLPDGTVVQTGGPCEDGPGYDLTGVIVGSEGTFGIVTKTWVRITRNPEAYRTLLGVFDSVDDATNTISDIIGAGIVPAALEMLDDKFIGSVEAAFKLGFPLDAGALLIMEVDGLAAGIQEEADRIEGIALKNGAREVRKANSDADRLALWKARKSAFGTVGRMGYASYCTQDGVVPRTKLPHIMRHIRAVSEKHGIAIANVFHAGDGNIHPVLMFDERDPDQVQRVLLASTEILQECVRLGGSVTGEHGIGVEKLDFMPILFAPEDLAYMVRLRTAFNPLGRCSPNKLLPTAGGCVEGNKVVATKPGRRAAV
ncbi:MAG: FAD-linked oxidase C-terminal domain-containing protein [Gemmataceae bacterium]